MTTVFKPRKPQPKPQDSVRQYKLSSVPLPSQARFLNSNALYKGFSGPVGSGKSMALVWQALKMISINPGCMGLIGAPTYTMLRDGVQRAFLNELDAIGFLPDRDYQYYKAEERFLFTQNGSSVVFRHLEDPDRLRGMNLAWFLIDEMTLVKEEAWYQLQSRMRDPNAKKLSGGGAWTPMGLNWVYETFIKSQNPNYEVIKAVPGENRHLRDDFYTNLGQSFDDRRYRQEVLGEYLNIYAGRAYYAFEHSLHVAPVEVNPHLPIRLSMDFNLDPMTAVIAQIHDDSSPLDRQFGNTRQHVHIIDEIFLKDVRTADACAEFIERLAGMNLVRPVEVFVYGDASGRQTQRASVGAKSDWEMVKQCLANQDRVPVRTTYRVRDGNPAIKDRVGSVNKILKNYNGEVRLKIHPKCKNLIRDLEQVCWEDGTAQIRKGYGDRERYLTHISDALGYLTEREFGFGGKDYGFRSESLF